MKQTKKDGRLLCVLSVCECLWLYGEEKWPFILSVLIMDMVNKTVDLCACECVSVSQCLCAHGGVCNFGVQFGWLCKL